jgi:hypothetical protein
MSEIASAAYRDSSAASFQIHRRYDVKTNDHRIAFYSCSFSSGLSCRTASSSALLTSMCPL